MPNRLIDYVWTSAEAPARIARACLAPIGAAFASAVAVRNIAYDRHWLPTHEVSIPTIAIGNLTVGGTGKTPVAAWVVGRLAARGEQPAVVRRPYGTDETLVHRLLNPTAIVVEDADRVRGVATAAASGATIAVLDDGFQHRQARRAADLVLISADSALPVRPLPAGPWREPMRSLVRASAVIVTRKRASHEAANDLLTVALRHAPHSFGAIISLAPEQLVNTATGEVHPLSAIEGMPVLAISAIGDPRSFESQLRATGAVVSSVAMPDHYRYSASDACQFAMRIGVGGWAVCTLKDAVKLAPKWPRNASPLWYLSQRVTVETGGESFEALLAAVAP